MSLDKPTINFRVDADEKAAFELHVSTFGKNKSDLATRYLFERVVTEEALALYRMVGLAEFRRRLTQPSSAWSQPTKEMGNGEGLTKYEVVTQGNAR